MKALMIYLSLIVFSLGFSLGAKARDRVIYNVALELPMGEENEELVKNYYVNIGKNQGIRKGSILNVRRSISREALLHGRQEQFSYNVPVGQLRVIHAEEGQSIAVAQNLPPKGERPYVGISNFIIGDTVEVDVD